MATRSLHVVCFDVPYPIDLGGAFDVYYKLQALHAEGINIKLHCYEYDRKRSDKLRDICSEVFYYERQNRRSALALRLPYVVSSRSNENLLRNLLKDDDPILFEGIHSTYFIYINRLPEHRCFVRLHNVKHLYYHYLHQASTSILKRMYYKYESRLLENYEKQMAGKATFFAVSDNDMMIFSRQLKFSNISVVPVFIPPFKESFDEGSGNFCLYHGNLGVPENEHAAMYLLKHVFDNPDVPFVIAGKNPSKSLQHAAHVEKHTCLVADPEHSEMTELLRLAQVNIVPSFNQTGTQFKLINALIQGKHCVVNSQAVDGSGLQHLCIIANTAEEMQARILKYYHHQFTEQDFLERKKTLCSLFNNKKNAELLIRKIFG